MNNEELIIRKKRAPLIKLREYIILGIGWLVAIGIVFINIAFIMHNSNNILVNFYILFELSEKAINDSVILLGWVIGLLAIISIFNYLYMMIRSRYFK